MKTIYIIGCGASKAKTPQIAMKLYTGSLFRVALGYAVNRADFDAGDALLILSAKHGLLPLDVVTAPYDVRWNDADAVDRSYLCRQIEGRDWAQARFVLLCAWPYAKRFLDAYFDAHNQEAEFEAPLRGLGIGQQTKWLRENTFAERACRVCGCTDVKACGFGCYWVEADLCSSCQKKGRPLDEI